MSYASLCVLSYERPNFLRECLRSIHETADYPFELIVHDDGSEDSEVYEVLEEFSMSTVILNPPGYNQGVGEAVRRMFGLASGEYLFKIDQDCTFEPGWLSEMIGVFEHNDAEFCAATGFVLVGTVGGFRYWVDPVDHNKMLIREHEHFDEVTDYVSSVFGVRRETWQTFGPAWETHSEAFAEDVGFKRSLTLAGHVHALTKRDVVHNHGFGVGPSTVVPDHDTVATINKQPFVFGWQKC